MSGSFFDTRQRKACLRKREKITSPQRDKAVESEKRRRGSSDSFVRPLALRLDAQMSARFGERDLDLPPADVQGDDVSRLDGDVGAEEGLWITPGVGVTNQDPSDRQHRVPGLYHKATPDVISSALPLTWPYQAETAILVQRVAGLDSKLLSFGSAEPFCAGRPIVRDVRFAGGANRFASSRKGLISVARRTMAWASSWTAKLLSPMKMI